MVVVLMMVAVLMMKVMMVAAAVIVVTVVVDWGGCRQREQLEVERRRYVLSVVGLVYHRSLSSKVLYSRFGTARIYTLPETTVPFPTRQCCMQGVRWS
jgi:hypothetical protein